MTLYTQLAPHQTVPWRVYAHWLAVEGMTVLEAGREEWAEACERWAGMSEERRRCEVEEAKE